MPIEPRPYTSRKFNSNTWVIEGVGCYSYLLLGADKAMMVDTGMNPVNLRKYVEKITNLPIEVVNTHGHFDHTGGNGWFEKSYMHPSAAKDAKRSFAGAGDYPLDYPIETVASGHTFSLGRRTLEVIEIPAHSPGSIALLDRENKLLFTGDELEAGQVLLHFGDATVERHHQNMGILKSRIKEYAWICPAHNGTPIDISYVDAFIENDQKVLEGVEGSTEIASPTFNMGAADPNKPFVRRSEHKGSSIIYDIRKIFMQKAK